MTNKTHIEGRSKPLLYVCLICSVLVIFGWNGWHYLKKILFVNLVF